MGLMVQLNRKNASQAAVDALRSGRIAEAQRYLDTAVGKSSGGGLAASAAVQSAARAASTPQVSAANTYTGSTSPMSNGLGVRSMLNQAGVDNSRIGWNGQSVTVDGRVFGTPDSVVDGTSYMSKANFQNAYNQLAASGGADQTQAATDWAAGKGVNNAVQWLGNGQASVFGRTMTPLYLTDDNKAVFRTSDLEDAYNAWKQSTGYMTGADVYNQINDKYGTMTDKALSDVLNREAWSYTPEDDAAYRAFRDQYTREGNRALEDAIAAQSGMTGGYINSAALTAGGQAQNYYMQQLADKIPELQAHSYDRYVQEDAMRRAALNSVLGVADDDYSKLYQTAAQDRQYINDAFDKEYERDRLEREWTEELKDRELSRQAADYNNQILAAKAAYAPSNEYYANQAAQLEVSAAEAQNRVTDLQQRQAAAEERGFYTADDMAVMGLPEGTDPYAGKRYVMELTEYYRQQGAIFDAQLDDWTDAQKSTRAYNNTLGELAAKDYYSARSEDRQNTYKTQERKETQRYESGEAEKTRQATSAEKEKDRKATAASDALKYQRDADTAEYNRDTELMKAGLIPPVSSAQSSTAASSARSDINSPAYDGGAAGMLLDAAKAKGYSNASAMPTSVLASTILQLNVSDKDKAVLLQKYGISDDYARLIFNALTEG